MALDFVGELLRVIGEVLIGVAILLVHGRMRKDQKIDEGVIKDIKREKLVGILGITFIIVGYLLTVFA